jgi:hypothetical protein
VVREIKDGMCRAILSKLTNAGEPHNVLFEVTALAAVAG